MALQLTRLKRAARIGVTPGSASTNPPALHAYLRVRVTLVEVFFAIIGRQALCRGDFATVEELVATIRRFCEGCNDRCQPVVWTKAAERILVELQHSTAQA